MNYTVEFFNEKFRIWETLEEISNIEADNAEEAVEEAKSWWIETSDDAEIADEEASGLIWRAAKIEYDEDGYLIPEEWEEVRCEK